MNYPNAIMETTTSVGVNDLALGSSPVAGHFALPASLDGLEFRASIYAVDGNGVPTGDIEICTATYHHAARTISRGAVERSSNGDAAVEFGEGTKRIAAVLSAADIATFLTSAAADALFLTPDEGDAAYDAIGSAAAAQAASQPLSANLTTWAGIAPSANVQSLVSAADYAAMRTLLDLEPGTDFYSISAADTLLAAKAPLASPTLTGTPLAPTAAGGTSTTQIATTAFVAAAVGAAVTGALEFKGSTDCSTNPNYPAADKGDLYIVTVAGKIGGASGTDVDIGDAFFATADNAGGTQAAVGTSWSILEHNLAGALLSANNLSDLADAATARTNLELGTLATQSGTFSGTSSGTNTGDQTNITGNAGTVTGLSVTAGKTLTVSNTLTLQGTDGSTLDVGTGGTLGTAAYAATGDFAAAAHTHTFASLTSKPTTLSGYGITDAQPLDGDLSSLAAATGTNTIYRRSAADTWEPITFANGIDLNASGVLRMTMADQNDMETEANVTEMITPFAVKYSPSAMKASCFWDMTGTPSISHSHNVSGITDVSTGNQRVNFTTSFSSSTAMVVTAMTGTFTLQYEGTLNAGYIQVTARNSAGTLVDSALCAVHVTGDFPAV